MTGEMDLESNSFTIIEEFEVCFLMLTEYLWGSRSFYLLIFTFLVVFSLILKLLFFRFTSVYLVFYLHRIYFGPLFRIQPTLDLIIVLWFLCFHYDAWVLAYPNCQFMVFSFRFYTVVKAFIFFKPSKFFTLIDHYFHRYS